MHVLLSDVFKQFYLRKTNFLETYQKSKFLEKKILRNALDLKSKKVHGISGKSFRLALLFSAVFHLQNRLSDFF